MSTGHSRLGGAPVRAALIDLDGTLLDTLPGLAAAAQRMLADLRLPAVPEEALEDFVGRGVRHLVQSCLEFSLRRAVDAPTLETALQRFDIHYTGSEASPYPGAPEGLERMAAAGIGLACVTNKASRYALALLSSSGLANFFDAIVTPETTGCRKPHPEPFRAACRVLGVAARNAVAIGDSAIDAEGARAAGCRFLLVPYGYRERVPLREIDSDGIVASLLEAADLFRAGPRANS